MLVLHCGAREVTIDELANVPTPPRTATYTPVPHIQLVEMLCHELTRVGINAYDECDMQFGLTKDDQQMFGEIRMPNAGGLTANSFGLRNSLDKTIGLNISSGKGVFVCDNMAFSAAGFLAMTRHTKNVQDRIRNLVYRAVAESIDNWREMDEFFDELKFLSLSHTDGYKLIGLAMGHGVLTPHQASRTYKEWDDTEHEEFKERNLWSLYNAFTEGLKRSTLMNMIPNHINTDDFFRNNKDDYRNIIDVPVSQRHLR